MGKIFLTGVGAPAAKPGVTSWNDLEDKPFGEIPVAGGGGDTIIWDGIVDPEDPAYGYSNAKVNFHKVSDSTPTIEDLQDSEISCILTIVESTGITTSQVNIPNNMIVQLNENIVVISEIAFIIYKNDTVWLTPQNIEVLFPQKGIYLTKGGDEIALMYVSSLTIKGYDFATYETKTLDPKYVSGIGQSNLSPEFQEFLKNLKPSASYNDLTNKPSIVLSVDGNGVLSLRVIHTEGTEPVEDFASYEKAENEDGEEIVGMTMNSTYGANQINDKTLEVN